MLNIQYSIFNATGIGSTGNSSSGRKSINFFQSLTGVCAYNFATFIFRF